MLILSEIETQGRSRTLFNLGSHWQPSKNCVQAYAASCDASDTAAGPALQTLPFPVTRA